MFRKLLKSAVLASLTAFLVIPACVHAFPTNSVVLANSLTFATFTVNIVGVNGANSYSPDTITIQSGDTVYWNNTDFISHTATCGAGTPCGQWDTGTISGVSGPVTNFSVGTTGYYCQIHGTLMYGAIITLPQPTSVTNWQYFTKKEKVENQPLAPLKETSVGIVFIPPNSKAKLN